MMTWTTVLDELCARTGMSPNEAVVTAVAFALANFDEYQDHARANDWTDA